MDRRSRSDRGNPDKLQDIAVIVEEEVEEQQQQETAENTTLNQASAAAWDPAIRNQRTPHKDDKHWHNDCRQGRFCILQDAYPTKQYGGRGRKRAVQKSWLEAYGWLEWPQEANALFCYPCCIFNSKRDNEWIKGGHSYFKKCTGAEGSLVKYANSLDHKAAEVCLCNIKLKKEMELLSALAGPVHASKVALEKMSTREYLKIMLQAVAFLAAGGLAFRGHDESSFSSNKGNFLRLLDLLASVSPDFAKQRERCPDNAKYTSPDSQKQLVQSFRHAVDQKIREELVMICLFLTLVIRYVSATTGERTIKTVHVADTKATTLRDALLVKGFGLNAEKCRGQGYDGASNMSGKHNGLAALIKMVCKHAMYTHCCAHRLNLIVEIIGKDVAEYQSVLGFLQQIITTSLPLQKEWQCLRRKSCEANISQ
ncbi:hypothetical protein EMCRGX_G007603 [Ephydatia muelleri]